MKIISLFFFIPLVSFCDNPSIEAERKVILKDTSKIFFLDEELVEPCLGGFKINLKTVASLADSVEWGGDGESALTALREGKWGNENTNTFTYSMGVHLIVSPDKLPVALIFTSGAPQVFLVKGVIKEDYYIYDEKSTDLGQTVCPEYYRKLGKRLEVFLNREKDPIALRAYQQIMEEVEAD